MRPTGWSPARGDAQACCVWSGERMFYVLIFGILAILLVVAGVMTIRRNKRTPL